MIDRGELVNWYRQNRDRSRGLFDLIEPAAYYTRPIALRNPIVFYEGHLPAFSLISLVKRGLGKGGVNEQLEQLFARGIDPDSESTAVPRSGASTIWPSRDEVLAFGARADALVVDALERGVFDLEGRAHPAMRRGEAIYTALEHEAMHQETLLYMWHRLSHEHKHKPANLSYEIGDASPTYGVARIPAGKASLGSSRAVAPFGWDNEFEAHEVQVPAFEIDLHSVTNADFLSFVEVGGYSNAGAVVGRGLGVDTAGSGAAPGVLGARRRSMVLARHVRKSAAAHGLAGVREPGGGSRVRGLERTPPADRTGVSPRRVLVAGWQRAIVSMGQ